jgi:hypothetical protein
MRGLIVGWVLGFRGWNSSNEAAAGLARALGRAARLADNQQQVKNSGR